MPDDVSQALQFWANLRAQQPLRDAQAQGYRDVHTDYLRHAEGRSGEAKELAKIGRKEEADQSGKNTLVDMLGAMGALTGQSATASPDTSGATTSAQTFPYQLPPPVTGRPMPLMPPAGGAPMANIPAPGQASVPMQAPGGQAPISPLAYLAKQPQNALPAALKVLLANAAGQGATARAPAPNAVPTAAPTAPPMAMGSGATPRSMSAPGGAPGGVPAGAPGAGPAPGVVPGPAPAGWQPLRSPQGPGGAAAAPNPDLPLGGRGVEPTKMPSVPVMAKRLLDSGVNPEAAYYALQDYEQIQDKETKQVMDGLKMQASVYRTMLSAGNERMRALASESAAEDRKASLAERTRHDKAMEAKPSGYGGQIGPIQSVIPEKDQDKHGDSYLATLPTGIAAELKEIAEGRINPSTLPYRGNQRQAALEMVSQYDPSFDQTQWAARNATRQDFGKGQSAKNIVAINTGIGHLGTMQELGNALNNNDVRAINSLFNRISLETGHPNVNSFALAKTAVSDELMRIFRQVGASDTEAARWETTFNSANSPAQLKQAIKTSVMLLSSRAEALEDQWTNTMGNVVKPIEVIHPRSQAVLKQFGIPLSSTGQSETGKVQEFATVEDAEKAGVVPGTRVIIGGKSGIVQ